jgi:hypothetical protein
MLALSDEERESFNLGEQINGLEGNPSSHSAFLNMICGETYSRI